MSEEKKSDLFGRALDAASPSPGSKKKEAVFCKYEDQYSSVAVWPSGKPFPVPLNKDNEYRFDFETRGPWSILTKLHGLAVEKMEGGILVHGKRRLDGARESGYNHEGYVNIEGKKKRAFTSSQLFMINGKLSNVAILYVVKKRVKEE